MAIDAIAAVKVPFERVSSALESRAELDDGLVELVGASGVSFAARPLSDGTIVQTLVGFDTAPDEVGLHVRQLLGELLDAHDDDRGILLFPSVVTPKAESFAELVDEIGAGGEWAPLVEAGYVPERLRDAPEGSLEGIMGTLMGAMGDQIAQLSQAVMSGDPDTMGEATQRFEEELRASGKQNELEAALGQFLTQASGDGGILEQLKAKAGDADLGDLVGQAEQIAQDNPDLLAALGVQPPPADEEEED